MCQCSGSAVTFPYVTAAQHFLCAVFRAFARFRINAHEMWHFRLCQMRAILAGCFSSLAMTFVPPSHPVTRTIFGSYGGGLFSICTAGELVGRDHHSRRSMRAMPLTPDDLALAAQACRAMAYQKGERAKRMENPRTRGPTENMARRYAALAERFERARKVKLER